MDREYFGIKFLLRYEFLSAIFITAINDHYLKYKFPSLLTGKLSDFSGVYLLPIFLIATIILFSNVFLKKRNELKISKSYIILAIILVDSFFIGIKAIEEINAGVIYLSSILGLHLQIVMDKTDLFALSMNIFTYRFLKKNLIN